MKLDIENHQYGNFLLLPFAHAAAESIEAAKDVLMEALKIYVPKKYRSKITWVVNPEYKLVTGRKIQVITCVGWKLGPIKKEYKK